MRSIRGWTRISAIAIVLSLYSATGATACPNCKEAVSATASESANMAQGFNWSVLFMLSVPLSLVGTGAFLVRRAVKNGAFPEL
jgi:hypothetical protein